MNDVPVSCSSRRPTCPHGRPGARAQARPSGFTLLELVLVLAVLLVSAGMAVATLRNFSRGRSLSEAASQLLALTDFARTQAIHESTVYRLNVDSRANTYWLTAWRGGAYVSPGGPFGRVFGVPDGVTLDWDAPQQADGTYVEFYPTSRVTPATVWLTDPGGSAKAVTCPSAAEAFSVVSNSSGKGGARRRRGTGP